MGIINETIEAMRCGDERDVAIHGCHRTLLKKYHSLKGMIPKDEWDDLWQDLVAYAYEQYGRWDPEKGSKLNTYITTRLLHFTDGIITRYTGIKTTRYQLNKYKKENGRPLVIRVEGFEEETYEG